MKLTIANKLAGGLGLLLVLLLGIGAVSIHQLSKIRETTLTFSDNWFPGVDGAGGMESAIARRRVAERIHITSTDPAESRRDEQVMAKADEDFTAAAKKFEAGIDTDAEKASFAEVQRLRADYMTAADQVRDLSRAGRKGEAEQVWLADGRKAYDAINSKLADLVQENRAGGEQATETASATYSSARNLALAVMLAALLLAVGTLVWLRRGIIKPVAALSANVRSLAKDPAQDVPHVEQSDEIGDIARSIAAFRDAVIETERKRAAAAATEQQAVTSGLRDALAALTAGDLTADIRTDFPPAYAELKTNFNNALAALRDLIGAVGDSAAAIRTGSAEIAQASEDLARRTESNAASLEETSASLVEIDGRLRASASAAARTLERADQANEAVDGGRELAEGAVQAMGRVSESAKGIDNVIEGLDKIAFQTRVLAMNAAVEAGRAGEAGRGFAVVADLVGQLAMRSEEEAKLAREQLTATQQDVLGAVETVQKVDVALADISGAVREVNSLLGSMASDNQAQSAAITQISAAVTNMDQATQQNAAMVEETSAAARNLSGEVAALSEQASRFRTGSEAAPRAAPRSVPAPAPAPRSFAPQAKAVVTAEVDWENF